MFFQPGVELTGRKVQGRYEKIEKEFMVLYKNPGTNASDKQVLTPLQALLKATGKMKDEQNDERMESAKEKADKQKYLGDLEKQYHMRGPSPPKASSSEASAAYDDDEEEAEVRRQQQENQFGTYVIDSGDEAEAAGARPRKKKRKSSSAGGEESLNDLMVQMTQAAADENARAAETAAAAKQEREEEKARADARHEELMRALTGRAQWAASLT
jgi:hypothetical protein